MVDRPKVESRLERLRLLLDELEQIRAAGRAAYDARRQRQADPAQLSRALPGLTELGLDSALAEHLAIAAGLRNSLVHDYLDIDEDVVWGSLDHLDDLRGFATFAEARLA